MVSRPAYFSSRSLLDKADLTADDPVRVLFDRLKTVDFERVVKALEGAAEVELAYGNGDHALAKSIELDR
jgi:hypothetical protein